MKTMSGISLSAMGCALLSAALIAGACSDAETSAPPTGGGATTCPTGFDECDGDEATVCEASLSSDSENCGMCGNRCTSTEGELASCEDGVCVVGCEATFADCNEDASDGCEADLFNDAATCGFCERSCGDTVCSNAACEIRTLAEDLPSPIGIAIDQDHVYWGNFVVGGSVMRVAKTGGAAETLAADIDNPYELEVAGGEVFFTAQGNPPASDGGVYRVPSDGGTVTEMLSAVLAASELALDDTHLYWASSHTDIAEMASIHRLPRTGGADEVLFAGERGLRDIRVHDGWIYWITISTPPAYDDGLLVRGRVDGTGREILLSSIPRPALEIAVADDRVYFGSITDGTVSSIALAGGEPTLLYAPPGEIKTLEIAGAFLYAATGNAGTTERYPLAGGQRIVLASGGRTPFDLVVDGEAVYWSDRGNSANDGAILKTAN